MERPTHCPVCQTLLGAPSDAMWCCSKEDHQFDMCHTAWVFSIVFKFDKSEIHIICNETYFEVFHDEESILEQERPTPSFAEAIEIIHSCKNNLMFV